MTPDDISDVLRLLAGHWPNPELGEDEIRVWTRTLGPLDLQMSAQTVDNMAVGRTWRPTDGEFLAEYRRARSRVPLAPVDKGEKPALLETTDHRDRSEIVAEMRDFLGSLGRRQVDGRFRHTSATTAPLGRYGTTDSEESRAHAREITEQYRKTHPDDEQDGGASVPREPKPTPSAPAQAVEVPV